MPGPYDYAQMQGPPTPSQWAGPQIDFSGLAKIPGELEQARQTAINRAVSNSLPEGLSEFYDPQTGTYDYRGLVDRLTRIAGPAGAEMADKLIGTAYNTQLTPAREATIKQEFPQLGTQQNENGGQSSQPQGYGTSGYPPPFAGSRTPKEGPAASGSAAITGQTDGARDAGGETLRSLATGVARGRDVGPIIARLAPRYGGPDAPLTAPQEAEARTLLGRLIPQPNATTGTPSGAPTGNAGAANTGGAGATSTISAQSNNQNSVGEPLSQSNQPNSAAEVARNGPQGSVAIAQPGVQAQPAPGYQALIDRANALRQSAIRSSTIGLKDRADQLNKQAEALETQAKNDPQYIAQAEAGKTLETGKQKVGETRLANFNAAGDSFNQQEKPLLLMAQSVLSNPDMYTGIGGKLSLDWNKVRAAVGDQNFGLMQQMLTKITAQSVLSDISQQAFDKGDAGASGGRIFKQTVDLVTQAAPTLEGTVAGNRALVQIKLRMGQVKSDIAQMANDYVRDPRHPYLDAGFDKILQDYGAKLKLWTQQELADPRLIAAPHMPGTLKNKEEASAWGKSVGLSPGDPFYGPKGQQLEMR